MSSFLSEEFVALRSKDRGFGAEGFHALLCLARLVGLSWGAASVSREAWGHACELEQQRQQRQQRLPRAQPTTILSATTAA
jgi:hypothetical protein